MIKKLLRVACLILLFILIIPLCACEGGVEDETTDDTTINEPATELTTGEPVTTAPETNAAGRIVIPAVSLDMLPAFSGGGAKKDYDCGGGVYMRYVDKVYEKELNAYLTGLEESGYTKLASWKIWEELIFKISEGYG